MKIHVFHKTLQKNEERKNYALGENIVPHANNKCFLEDINNIIWDTKEDYALVVTDHVFLPKNIIKLIDVGVKSLDKEHPGWGLATDIGVSPLRLGYFSTQVIKMSNDLDGGPNSIPNVIPIYRILGEVLLLNTNLLRKNHLYLPTMKLHQFDENMIVLSIEMIKAKLGLFVIPQLACFCSSTILQRKVLCQSHELICYLDKNKINSRMFLSLEQCDTLTESEEGAFNLPRQSLKNSIVMSQKKVVAFVIRTRFTRINLLKRTLNSIQNFKDKAGSSVCYNVYLVSDCPLPENLVLNKVVYIHAPDVSFEDSRFYLIHYASEQISSDLLWFIDDDDWLLADYATDISLMIANAPYNALIYINTFHVMEDMDDNPSHIPVTQVDKILRIYLATEFMNSLYKGYNYIPMCGNIFPRKKILSIPRQAWETITYSEDYLCQLYALMDTKLIPMLINYNTVAISIRSKGENTVTEKSRIKWNVSHAELVSYLMNHDNNGLALLSVNANYSSAVISDIQTSTLLCQIKSLQHIISEIHSSKSWRITSPLRYIMRLLKGETAIFETFIKK